MDQMIINVVTQQTVSSDCFYFDKKKHEDDIATRLEDPLKKGWNLVTRDPVTTEAYSGWVIPPGETAPFCIKTTTTTFILEKAEEVK